MSTRRLSSSLVALAMVTMALSMALTTRPVSAAIITTYTTRADFDLAVGPTTLEDLNAVPLGTPFVGAPLDLGAFSLLRTAIGQPGGIQSDVGTFNIDGSPYGFVVTQAPLDMVFTFDSPISAFGLDVVAWNDGFIRTTVEADGTSVPVTSQVGQGSRFFGFSSDTAFTQVRFIGGTADAWSFDNITFASTEIPEPATLTLFAVGLGALGFVGWRRRHSSQAA